MKNKDYTSSLLVGILSGLAVFSFTKSYDILQNSNWDINLKVLIPLLFLLIYFILMLILGRFIANE